MPLTKKQNEVYQYIKQYIDETGVSPTQAEIKEYFGFKSYGSVQDFLRYLIKAGKLKNSTNQVRGIELADKEDACINIPLLGSVAAGCPIEAVERDDTISVPEGMVGRGEYFALKVEGSSMIEDGIFDEDIIVVKKQNRANNGETVVALIDGEATVKRLNTNGKNIKLMPANHLLEPIEVSIDCEFKVIGTVSALFRAY